MHNALLLGVGRRLIPIPAFIWQRQVKRQIREITQMDRACVSTGVANIPA